MGCLYHCMQQSLFVMGGLLRVDKPPATCITYNFYTHLTMLSIYKITFVKDNFKFIQHTRQMKTSKEQYYLFCVETLKL